MLRDETDWDPLRMLAVGLSFGKTPEPVQHALKTMRPKENSDQRKKRLRKEAREAKESKESTTKKASTSRGKSNAKAKQAASKKSSSKIQAKIERQEPGPCRKHLWPDPNRSPNLGEQESL